MRACFSERSLDAWAVGHAAAYHLHIPRLWGRVLPRRCSVKVNEKRKKAYLMLHKESDAEWRFIKG